MMGAVGGGGEGRGERVEGGERGKGVDKEGIILKASTLALMRSSPESGRSGC